MVGEALSPAVSQPEVLPIWRRTATARRRVAVIAGGTAGPVCQVALLADRRWVRPRRLL